MAGVCQALERLNAAASSKHREGMARFGIDTAKALRHFGPRSARYRQGLSQEPHPRGPALGHGQI